MKPCIVLAALLLPVASLAADLPRVASINLCTDQLVLSIAAPEQIASLSWLSADPNESMLADEAAGFPLNYGTAEELLQVDAAVVVAGSETSPFTRQMLRRLGFDVVDISPANDLDGIARNLTMVGAAIGRAETAAIAIDDMRSRADALELRAAAPQTAVVVRPGGFTVARDTLADGLMRLAGLDNAVAELDRWGSLSVEALLTARPDVIVFARYRPEQASLANRFLAHPALADVRTATRSVVVDSKYWACGVPASLESVALLLEQLGRF